MLQTFNKAEDVNSKVVSLETKKMRLLTWGKHILICYMLAFAVFFVLFRVIFGLCWVNGNSMYPTYQNGDYVFFNRVDRVFDRGDVIIAQVQVNEEEPAQLFFKRIIAVAGDTIEVDEESQQVILNGEPLYEPYVNPGYFNDGDMDGAITIPEGYVFVMGDNRPASIDSRVSTIGLISEDHIRGTVMFRLFHYTKS